MPSASFVSKINNKKVLFGAIAVFIFPFIIFSFWNFPSADDYMIIDKRGEFTFWGLQHSIYQNWTGRYFATFISSIFSYSGFLYSHYYLHTILLLFLTFFAWFFFLKQVNKYVLKHNVSSTSLVLLSLLLLIVEINVIPEPVTAFYWFSSAVTYQLPLVIFIFLAGIIVNLLFVSPNKTIPLVSAGILIIILNGCNEIITLFVLTNSTIVLGYYLLVRKRIPVFLTSLYALNLVSACFLLFSPGIINRGGKLDQGSFIASIGIGFIKFIILNWFFLKEPLWWFSLFLVVAFCSYNQNLFQHVFKDIKKLSLASFLVLYLASGLFLYVPVLYVTNGSLPLRAENIICLLYSLMLIYVITSSVLPKTNLRFYQSFYNYRYLLLSILIFSTANMKRVTDSLLSGYFYNLIMRDRLSAFENARERNEHEVTFDDYEAAVNKKLKGFPQADRQLIKDIIVKPPPIICFGDDLYDVNYMKEFYGIKKLNVIKN